MLLQKFKNRSKNPSFLSPAENSKHALNLMLNCLIVEDEPLAAGIVEDYIRQVPSLRLIGKCGDALDALEALQEAPVDVLFLDIHLPGLKGLDMLRTLRHAPQVILTTAYHEYALEGYEYGVVDYLLKPIGFERFIKAVQKLKTPPAATAGSRRFQFFNVNKKMVRVWLDEIGYVESLKEYVRFFLPEDKTVVTKMQIGEIERMLDGAQFLRIHRSYLVALRHIESFSSTEVTVGGRHIPIGRQYKDDTLAVLEQLIRM